MLKFLLGIVVGILLATNGASGVARMVDNSVNWVVKAAKNAEK